MVAWIWSKSISMTLGVSSEKMPAATAALSAAHLRLWFACIIAVDCNAAL
jgi:hypothetical protein